MHPTSLIDAQVNELIQEFEWRRSKHTSFSLIEVAIWVKIRGQSNLDLKVEMNLSLVYDYEILMPK